MQLQAMDKAGTFSQIFYWNLYITNAHSEPTTQLPASQAAEG
jgi:hypothetical protein